MIKITIFAQSDSYSQTPRADSTREFASTN